MVGKDFLYIIYYTRTKYPREHSAVRQVYILYYARVYNTSNYKIILL